MKNSVSIVIGSCDAYADIATLYVKFLRKYWRECSYPVYVAMENKTIEDPSVITVKNNDGDEWVKRIIKTVEQTNSRYIWLTVDDLFIYQPVNNQRIDELLSIIEKEGIQYYGFPVKPKRRSQRRHYKRYKYIYSISRDIPYGVNMGTAIWEKDELLRILNDGIETAWDVENYFLEKASKRPGGYYEHYVDDDGSSIKLAHMIKKGQWIKKGVKEISGSGIGIDFDKRGYVPLKSEIRSVVVGIGNAICPVGARASVKKVLTKVGFRFATKY